jgi:hypothetical protein
LSDAKITLSFVPLSVFNLPHKITDPSEVHPTVLESPHKIKFVSLFVLLSLFVHQITDELAVVLFETGFNVLFIVPSISTVHPISSTVHELFLNHTPEPTSAQK